MQPNTIAHFWLKWVLLTALVWPVAVFFTFAGAYGVPADWMADPLLGALTMGLLLAMCGAFVAGAQWVLLRRLLPGSDWWVTGGALGLIAGPFPAVLLERVLGSQQWGASGVGGMAVAVIAGGAVAAALQWVWLRRYSCCAARWLVAGPLGWAAALLGGALVYRLLPGRNATAGEAFLAGSAAMLTAGVILGMVGGGVMRGVLQHPLRPARA